MKGQIPPELVKEAKGGEVHVDMEDHRDEEFVKPKVSARPFQGAGKEERCPVLPNLNMMNLCR